MGDGMPEDCLSGFQRLCQKSNADAVSCLLVVAEKQKQLYDDARRSATKSCRVLLQPLTLRDLHTEIREGLSRTGHLPSKVTRSADKDD